MITTGTNLVQVMQLKEGGVNLGAGDYTVGRVIHCVEDGAFTAKWESGNTDTINMAAGQDYGLKNIPVTIVSGTYHID